MATELEYQGAQTQKVLVASKRLGDEVATLRQHLEVRAAPRAAHRTKQTPSGHADRSHCHLGCPLLSPSAQLSTQTEAETASKLSVLQAVVKKLNSALADSREAAEAKEARLRADLDQARRERQNADTVCPPPRPQPAASRGRVPCTAPSFLLTPRFRDGSGPRSTPTASTASSELSSTDAVRRGSSTTGLPANIRTLRSCRTGLCAAAARGGPTGAHSPRRAGLLPN